MGIVAWVACLAPLVEAQKASACEQLQQLIASTYDFRPSQLTAEQLTAKGKQMDSVWQLVRDHRKELVPCLRNALKAPGADVMFQYDCSALLVELDPSRASKELQVRCLTDVALEDVDKHRWIATLAQLGFEGLDVSQAADVWLSDPKATYLIPEHGTFESKGEEGALFLLGSMEEAQALAALRKLIARPEHPGRDAAVHILMNLATPEALRALKDVDPAGLPDGTRKSLEALRGSPVLVKPSARPIASREAILLTLDTLFEAPPPGARNLQLLKAMVPEAVAVLQPKDLPRVREVRRKVATWSNIHAIDGYNLLTSILMARTWTAALVK
ncbi:MAG TPA: hypothetical protein VFY71_10090 [Planctomycetota bacterium]|nr:hypothetical protein [Planctomycetota bacterium]